MNEETNGSANCPVIDTFIGQGMPPSGPAPRPDGTNTAGCAIITEFIGLGFSTFQPDGPKTETSHPSAPPPAP